MWEQGRQLIKHIHTWSGECNESLRTYGRRTLKAAWVSEVPVLANCSRASSTADGPCDLRSRDVLSTSTIETELADFIDCC